MKPVVGLIGFVFRDLVYVAFADFNKVGRDLNDFDTVAGVKHDISGGNAAIVNVARLLFAAVDVNMTVFVEVFAVDENVVPDMGNA